MKGNQSSQYFTALLQVAPYSQTDVEIRVDGDLVSKPYIDLTIAVMRDFGVEVVNRNYRSFTVHAGQRYEPRAYQIEPDASNASYFFAAAALTGGRVRVPQLTAQSVQGDIAFVDICSKWAVAFAKTRMASKSAARPPVRPGLGHERHARPRADPVRAGPFCH